MLELLHLIPKHQCSAFLKSSQDCSKHVLSGENVSRSSVPVEVIKHITLRLFLDLCTCMTLCLSMSELFFFESALLLLLHLSYFSLRTFLAQIFFLVLLHPDRFGMARYLFQGQCRHVCPEGFFHSARRRCEPCPANCIVCTVADRCLHCSPGHKLRNGQCVTLECSSGERHVHIRLCDILI